jgi:MoxR-like ATPase
VREHSSIQGLEGVARALDHAFLGKSEAVRLLIIAAVAGEHLLLVGPPGTAKSALIRMFARLVDARYFEYLLTRFTEPNELFGPIDIQAFREGNYQRRMEGMLPTAEVLFLDEIFKANSAILNSLLGVLNERIYTVGGATVRVPLLSCFAASNEVPTDDDLLAVYDRFLLRLRSDNLDSYRFEDLLLRGLEQEASKITGEDRALTPLVTASELRELQRLVATRLREIPRGFLAQYKALVFQVRAEGVSISDRRAVKMLKLFCASALVDGRAVPDAGDLQLLEHTFNTVEQIEILSGAVRPVVEQFHQEHPERRRAVGVAASLESLLVEIQRIRELIVGDRPLSDVQLFAHMKALGEIKTALLALGTPPAKEASARIDQLLGYVYQTGKFGS